MAYRFEILFYDKTHFLSLIFKFIFLRGRRHFENSPLQPTTKNPLKSAFLRDYGLLLSF